MNHPYDRQYKEWELVTEPSFEYATHSNPCTYRLKVPHGWLYRVIPYDPSLTAGPMCFVPDHL